MRERTPGYAWRLEIFFTTDKHGKPRAYHWSSRQFRAFPLPLAEAELMRATGTADVLHCHPFKPCAQCQKAAS